MDSSFSNIISQDIEDHIARIKTMKNFDEKILKNIHYYSTNYLLEECSGLAVIYDVKDTNICDFYPGNLAKCFEYFKRKDLILSLSLPLPSELNGLSKIKMINLDG